MTSNLQATILFVLLLSACSANESNEIAEVQKPSLIDIEGNTYRTVKIGDQTWMAENLRTSTYRDGSPIQEVTWDLQWESLIRGAWSYQENYTPYDSLLGKLYNWYAVTDPRGLCPEGWHVPSDDEWIKLSDFLGENSGYKMKSSAFWNDNNNGSDESGFNGLPGGGRRSDGSFFGLGNLGYYWSSTWDNRRNAWFRYLGERTATLERKSNDVRLGLSVRCVKD